MLETTKKKLMLFGDFLTGQIVEVTKKKNHIYTPISLNQSIISVQRSIFVLAAKCYGIFSPYDSGKEG